VEKIDQKIEIDADFAKKVDSDEAMDEEKLTLDFDSDEIDIEFEFEGAIKEQDLQRERAMEKRQFRGIDDVEQVA
jgi:hypothetical protein